MGSISQAHNFGALSIRCWTRGGRQARLSNASCMCCGKLTLVEDEWTKKSQLILWRCQRNLPIGTCLHIYIYLLMLFDYIFTHHSTQLFVCIVIFNVFYTFFIPFLFALLFAHLLISFLICQTILLFTYISCANMTE